MDPLAQTICPAPLRLRVIRGDSIDIRLRLFDGATGRPIVLTGWAGVVNVYRSANPSVADFTLAVDVDQSPAGGATTGAVTILADAGDTTAWGIEFGAWSLMLTSGTQAKTIAAGPFELAPLSLAAPGFACSSGAGLVGLCVLPGFALVGGDCGVLGTGYTALHLPQPAAACGCS